MSKRPNTEPPGDDEPPVAVRKIRVAINEVGIGPVSDSNELNSKLLRYQNRRLGERVDAINKKYIDLERKLSQQTERKSVDDALMSHINDHWNILDQNLMLLLSKFDCQPTIEDLQGKLPNVEEETKENLQSILDAREKATEKFISELECLEDNTQLSKILDNQVKFSTHLFHKIISVFETLKTRKNSILTCFLSKFGDQSPDQNDDEDCEGKVFANSERVLREEVSHLQKENTSLHEVNSELQAKYHSMMEVIARLKTEIVEKESQLESAHEDMQDFEYQIDVAQTTIARLEHSYKELKAENFRQAACAQGESAANPEVVSSSSQDSNFIQQLQAESDDWKELAERRKEQIDSLSDAVSKLTQKSTKLEDSLANPPKEIILHSPDYMALQSRVSAVMADMEQLQVNFDETRSVLTNIHQSYAKQIEDMSNEQMTDMKVLSDELAKCQEQATTLKTVHEKTLSEQQRLTQAEKDCSNQVKQVRSFAETVSRQYSLLRTVLKTTQQRLQFSTDQVNNLKDERRLLLEEKAKKETVDAAAPGNVGGAAEGAPSTADGTAGSSTTSEATTDSAMSRTQKFHAEEILNLKMKLRGKEKISEELEQQLEETSSAFVSLQEKYQKLFDGVAEKEKINLDLISSNLDTQHKIKSLSEQKACLMSSLAAKDLALGQIEGLVQQQESQISVLQNALRNADKEIAARQTESSQAKRKASEAEQATTELGFFVTRYQNALKQAQTSLLDKSESLHSKTQKCNVLEAENSRLTHKLERAKKAESLQQSSSGHDEILEAENKKLKQILMCTSCKSRKKNAILTKCFHVFCYECLQTRYQTRQRKCPICAMAFGLSDYHRIFLKR